MNNTPLINRKAVKQMALDLSKANQGGKFTRVGSEFLIRNTSTTFCFHS